MVFIVAELCIFIYFYTPCKLLKSLDCGRIKIWKINQSVDQSISLSFSVLLSPEGRIESSPAILLSLVTTLTG